MTEHNHHRGTRASHDQKGHQLPAHEAKFWQRYRNRQERAQVAQALFLNDDEAIARQSPPHRIRWDWW